MKSHAQHDAAQELTARQVIANSAVAVRQVGSAMAELETALWSQAHSLAAAHASVQRIDSISQTLVELEQTFIRLASQMDALGFVSAETVIDPIKLEHLRELLASSASQQAIEVAPSNNQPIQLFE